ncbi:LuxR family two component transcriptional regulator [Chitinophaga skermanii]|uniref:LuxR family two component transcriptional regulator n=1 Tax=Chitinophaga skermanii TaxID=331697 RepID=A0A327Q104_9BACT|nr:response regulator transcription factor [Chitinophaga skermanii]RAI97713.1 LuxR family two component transcriptional regulator [Chitinophaga skermanii]
MKISIGIIDDHQLFLKSLALMLESFKTYDVVIEALNGQDLQQKLTPHNTPEMMLIDVNMPIMDGIATAAWLHKNHPTIKLVALSMNETDDAILGMLKAGCCAYLLKDTHPNTLEKALQEIHEQGFYNADAANVNFRRLLMREQEQAALHITPKERAFLQHACSDMTYKQIAQKMGITEKTVEGYREALFAKMHVQSRVGLCLEAIRKGIVQL